MTKPEPGSRLSTRTIADAKAHFAECVREAEAGRPIVLTRHGRPVARIVPVGDESGLSDVSLADRESRHIDEVDEIDEIAESTSGYATAEPESSPQSPVARREALRTLLDAHIWPRVPKALIGRGVSKQEREEILGFAPSSGAGAKAPLRDRR